MEAEKICDLKAKREKAQSFRTTLLQSGGGPKAKGETTITENLLVVTLA